MGIEVSDPTLDKAEREGKIYISDPNVTFMLARFPSHMGLANGGRLPRCIRMSMGRQLACRIDPIGSNQNHSQRLLQLPGWEIHKISIALAKAKESRFVYQLST